MPRGKRKTSPSKKTASPKVSPAVQSDVTKVETGGEAPPTPQLSNREDCYREFRDSPLCKKCSDRESCAQETEASLKPCFENYPGDAHEECPQCPAEEECKSRTQQKQPELVPERGESETTAGGSPLALSGGSGKPPVKLSGQRTDLADSSQRISAQGPEKTVVESTPTSQANGPQEPPVEMEEAEAIPEWIITGLRRRRALLSYAESVRVTYSRNDKYAEIVLIRPKKKAPKSPHARTDT